MRCLAIGKAIPR